MITSTSLELDESTIASRGELLGWLQRSFDTEFRFAVRDQDGTWHYVETDQAAGLSDPVLDVAVVEACDRVVDSRSPCVSGIDYQAQRVAVPLPGRSPRVEVAVGVVENTPPQVLERMAELWVTAVDATQQAERFQSENGYFAEQLSDDLEELTFLREMVEHLEVSDQSHDLMALAASTLPLLNETIKAQSLVLLMASEGTDPLGATPAVCAGEQSLDDSIIMRVVRQFGGSAKDQPVVKNQLTSAADEGSLPGVREFILVPLASRSRLMGWLLAVNRHWPDGVRPESEWPLSQLEFGTSEASLLSTTASILATHASNLDLFREKEQILVSVVRSLVSAVDAKDKYTCGHSERVALFGRILAEQVGYNEDQCERLYLTGLLHDVGKIGVSDAVLKKAGQLTDEEFAEIKRHPDEGWAILHDLEQLQYVLPGVLFHHERVDGGGYPDGLPGAEIPLDGRLLAIVDAYDAMTSDRPYRSGMPPERAQEILRSGAGTQWDADLVEHFFAVLDEIEEVRKSHQVRRRPTRERGCSG
jgi:response regulator RpfG family c-di-GMP phosphodiesterase